MTKRACLFYLLTALVALAGCGEVESCLEMDTPGCLLSPVRTVGPPCLYDLVAVNGICLESDVVNTKCGPCSPGSLCDESTLECVNFCAVPPVAPGTVPPPEKIFCEAIKDDQNPNPPMLSFEDVCRRRCRLNCQRLAQFCPGYQCAAGACDAPEVQNKCVSDCPRPAAGGNDLACLTKSCNDTRFAVCSTSLSCPNGVTPSCANIRCSNSCQFNGANVTGDGYCDDGDVFSSYTGRCEWGTDCTDCGPRTGDRVLGGYGDLCLYHLNCAGGTGSPDTAGAWCVTQDSVQGGSRCMPDCSRKQSCAPGFTCRTITVENEDGSVGPIMAGKLSSQACLPDVCL